MAWSGPTRGPPSWVGARRSVQLTPGSYSVLNRGEAQMEAFGLFLERNTGNVRLFTQEGAEALVFEPGSEASELATFQVFSPVTWDLPQVPVPLEFAKEPRPDAVPALKPESPGKGKPDGLVPGFGGDLFTGSQLAWLVVLGLFLYSQAKRRSPS